MSNQQFYAGFTSDLKRRFREHCQGKDATTKRYLPVRIIFYEAFLSESDARRREQYFKTTKGKATLQIMLRETIIKLNIQK